VSTIRATISPTILSKADRLFRNDDAGVFAELLQNAHRAGASRVEILVEQTTDSKNGSKVTFHDNGSGIDDFQSLLTLGGSDWSAEVRETEDPAGMGFFALCHSALWARLVRQQMGRAAGLPLRVTIAPSVIPHSQGYPRTIHNSVLRK
jgi:Histidine kinase-, DNA gyrase B-, and HSP90-like ATPase